MRRRQSLPVAEWPAADRTLWAGLTRGGGVLDPRGPLAHLKSVSLDGIAVCHGRWLCWVAQVHPAALAEDPVARCTGARFVAWLADSRELAPASRQRQAEKVLRLLRAAAPDADWRAHERQVALLRREARLTPSRRKAGRILSSACLLRAALDLAARNPGPGSTPDLRDARRRRDATMVAVLAVMPLRRRAFVALALGRSVLRDGDRIVIALDATMTKTGQVWEAAVPEGAIRNDILTERSEDPGAPRIERAHRPRYLLSGLLNCGSCGAGCIMISATRYGCSAARNRGTCANRSSIARAAVEARVLAGLRDRLMHPALIATFVSAFHAEMQDERREALAARGEQERRLATVIREINAVVTAIMPSANGRVIGLLAAFEFGMRQRHDQFDPAIHGPFDDLERRDLPAHRQIANRIEIPGRKPHHLPPVTALLFSGP